MDLGTVSSWVSAAVGLIVISVGAIMFVVRQGATLEKRMDEQRDTLRGEIAAAQRAAEREAEKVGEVQDKARHAMSNSIMVQLTQMGVKIEKIETDAVRKQEIIALEQRLTVGQTKIENKVDGLVEKIGHIGTLEAMLKNLQVSLDRITQRVSN